MSLACFSALGGVQMGVARFDILGFADHGSLRDDSWLQCWQRHV